MAENGIEINDRAVRKFFARVINNVNDIKEKDKVFWGALSAIAFKDVLDHFNKEQSPSGKWQKWSQIYADHMSRIGRSSNKILQFNGFLRQNVRIADTRTRMKQGQLLYNPAQTKSGFPYAHAHNEGDGMPKREFMWISDNALTGMSKIMAEHTLKGT